MGKLRSTLTCIWYYIAMALACFLPYTELYQIGMPEGQTNNALFFVISAVTLLAFIIYFVCEHKANKMKIDWILAVVFILLVGINIYSIWNNADNYIFFDGATNSYKEVYIGTFAKIRYTIMLVIMFLLAYSTAFVLGRHELNSDKLLWFAIVITAAGFIACCYSAYTDVYTCLKSGIAPWNAPVGAHAFFGGENMFAMFLFFTLISSLIVIHKRPRLWWFWIFPVIFLFFIFCSTSTTAVALSILLIVSFILLEIIFSFAKKRFVRATIGTIVILFCATCAILVAAIGYANGIHTIVSAVEFIKNAILDKNFVSFSGRTQLWEYARQMSSENIFKTLFGYGYGISNPIFDFYTRVDPPRSEPHSGFYQILLSFGWIGLGLYILLLVYYVYCIIRLLSKKKVTFALTYLLFAGFTIAYECFESFYIFEYSAFGLFLTLMIFLPPMVAWKQIKHNKFKQSVETTYVIPTQGVPSHNFIPMATMFITPIILALALSMIVEIPYAYLYRRIALLIVCALVVSLLFVPYLVFLWYKKSTDRRFIARIILNGAWIVGIPIASALLFAMFKLGYLGYFISIGIYLVCLVVATLIYSFARKGNIKQWFKNFIKGTFVSGIIPLGITAVIELVMFLILPKFITIDALTLITLVIAGVIIYWAIYLIIPSKHKKEILKDFNEEGILTYKRFILEDEK